MAKKPTLNAASLEALGAERLAALLIEISQGNADAKRRLRLELAGSASGDLAAQEVRKRLTTLARSTSSIKWHRCKKVASDLDAQRMAIADHVQPTDPDTALALLWQLLATASPTLERAHGQAPSIVTAYEAARDALVALAQSRQPDPADLAGSLFAALQRDAHDICAPLVEDLKPVLGDVGLEHLKTQAENYLNGLDPSREGRHGLRHKQRFARGILAQVADARGDVDGYVAAIAPDQVLTPPRAIEIATRYLAANRPQEAWDMLESIPADALNETYKRVVLRDKTEQASLALAWEETRLLAMEGLGQTDQAQSLRWQYFEQSLEPNHLRAFVARLPDFDDIEAEDQGLDQVMAHEDATQALRFLIDWPALDRAARMVAARADALEEIPYDLMQSALEALTDRYPLAAMLLHRAVVDAGLAYGSPVYYDRAAKHLLESLDIATQISDFGDHPDPARYVDALQSRYGVKKRFWQKIDPNALP